MNKSEIARKVNVSPQMIYQWLKGDKGIGKDTAIALGRAYDIDPGFFMFSKIETIKDFFEKAEAN